MEHAHVPYVTLLTLAMQKWTSSHDGAVPRTGVDRRAFRAALKLESQQWQAANAARAAAAAAAGAASDASTSTAPASSSSSFPVEENYEEAIKFSYRCWSVPEVPSEVAAVLADARASPAAMVRAEEGDAAATTAPKAAVTPAPLPHPHPFWLLARAVNAFMAADNEGVGVALMLKERKRKREKIILSF
jgi:hypothetical protein